MPSITLRALALAGVCGLVLPGGARAEYCLERPEIDPGDNCESSPEPDIGTWDALSWGWRTLDPNTCNPTDMVRMKRADALPSAPRNRATEKRVVLFGDLLAAPRERVPAVDPRVRALFEGADLIIGNIEAPVEDRYDECWRPDFDPAGNFRVSTDYLKRMFAAYGIDRAKTVITAANNHSGDQGRDGVSHTRTSLAGLGFKGVVGVRDDAGKAVLSIHDIGALRLGVYGWTETENCLLSERVPGTLCYQSMWPTAADVEGPELAAAKAAHGIDLLVGTVHWGEDFYTFPSGATRARAYELDRMGFDLIAAHHPHVLQPAESWSPGNMTFYSLAGMNLNWALSNYTMTPAVEVIVSESGQVVEYRVHPFVFAKLSSPASIPCRETCTDVYYSAWDQRDRCTTDWTVIPLEAVPSLPRARIQDELDRVFAP